MFRIIGDIHCKFDSYIDLISTVNSSIQIGDFGIGFNEHNDKIIGTALQGTNHRFIRGNHDCYDKCLLNSNFIDDGHVEHDCMFIGGAYSVDRSLGIENIDWWANEEIEYKKWNDIFDLYELAMPSILFTHDCPQSVANEVFFTTEHHSNKTMTRQALDVLYQIHQPKLHVFGHWHRDVDQMIGGTRFICLSELNYIDLNLDTLEVIKKG